MNPRATGTLIVRLPLRQARVLVRSLVSQFMMLAAWVLYVSGMNPRFACFISKHFDVRAPSVARRRAVPPPPALSGT